MILWQCRNSPVIIPLRSTLIQTELAKKQALSEKYFSNLYQNYLQNQKKTPTFASQLRKTNAMAG